MNSFAVTRLVPIAAPRIVIAASGAECALRWLSRVARVPPCGGSRSCSTWMSMRTRPRSIGRVFSRWWPGDSTLTWSLSSRRSSLGRFGISRCSAVLAELLHRSRSLVVEHLCCEVYKLSHPDGRLQLRACSRSACVSRAQATCGSSMLARPILICSRRYCICFGELWSLASFSVVCV